MHQPNDALFYVGQKAFIEHNGKILILFTKEGKPDVPGGKIQDNETNLEKALKREVQEETGLSIKIIEPFTTWHFALPSTHMHAGEKVYLVGFYCATRSARVTLSADHSGYRFVDKNDFKLYTKNSIHYRALKKFFKLYELKASTKRVEKRTDSKT